MAWAKKTRKPKAKQSALVIAKKALSLAKKNVGEVKTLDTTNSFSPDYNGSVYLINQVSQGTTRVQRVGKATSGKYITLKGYARMATTATHPGDSIRLMVICDTSNQGTDPTAGTILETVGSSAAPYSNLDQLANGRFKVLYSKLFALSIVGDKQKVFSKYIKLRSTQYYEGTASTDSQKNALYLVALSARSSAQDPPVLEYYARYGYTDN